MRERVRSKRLGGGCYAKIRRLEEEVLSQWQIVLMENVSSGGICFSCYEAPEPEERIELKLDLPPDKYVRCFGRVCWVEEKTKEAGATLYHFGTGFTDYDEHMEGFLERFVIKNPSFVVKEDPAYIMRPERVTMEDKYIGVYLDSEDRWCWPRIYDLSLKGILLEWNEKALPQGDVKIRIKALETWVECDINVAREESGKNCIFGSCLGAIFTDLNDEQRIAIERLMRIIKKNNHQGKQ